MVALDRTRVAGARSVKESPRALRAVPRTPPEHLSAVVPESDRQRCAYYYRERRRHAPGGTCPGRHWHRGHNRTLVGRRRDLAKQKRSVGAYNHG